MERALPVALDPMAAAAVPGSIAGRLAEAGPSVGTENSTLAFCSLREGGRDDQGGYVDIKEQLKSCSHELGGVVPVLRIWWGMPTKRDRAISIA